MQREQSHRQFNNSVEKRVRKDELIDRIERLSKSNGITTQSIRAIDPSLKPFEITYLFSNDIDRLGVERLSRIEASILAALEMGAAA